MNFHFNPLLGSGQTGTSIHKRPIANSHAPLRAHPVTEQHSPDNQHMVRNKHRRNLCLSPRRPHSPDELQNSPNVRIDALVPVAHCLPQSLEQLLVLLALMKRAREFETLAEPGRHSSDALVRVRVVPRHQGLVCARVAPHRHSLDGALPHSRAIDGIRRRDLAYSLVAKQLLDVRPKQGALLAALHPAAPPALANKGEAVVEPARFPLGDEEGLQRA